MFGKRARSGAGGEGATRARRREGRGLGPFSGGQITTMIVTFALLLLFPIGAWAVSFSNVAITDPGGVNRAKVDSLGSLQTKVSGAVTTQATPPSREYNVTMPALQSNPLMCSNVTAAVPAGNALVVTSLTVAVNSGVTTPPFDTWVEAGTASTPCSVTAGKFIAYAVSNDKIATINIPMPSGVTFKAGHTVSIGVHALGAGSAQADVTVHGYLVASGQCQAAAGGPIGCY
jgi:hypothetical protein